ncbi:MAG TPA: cation diffusion facilitator family transporter [Polynucleobacter sp.]|nr:cation diffusion facilitator family transporter [Polynucleobacter sp.]HQS60262.1 cation diffusion facilitator family transporter [Polynucleobacter sp.]HQT21284.1 cation diffusion facilitator family transporter [Polynucleobacter sp.]HQT41665.1 cation diffusion facilitator family transporter [Polynucleobacter sp.]
MHNHDTHADNKPKYNAIFGVGIALNVIYVAVEAFYGWKIDSLALIADAGHNLSDVAGLLLAWAATFIASLRPNMRHTYGWQKASIMAAFMNAALLLVAMGSLILESIQRLQSPEPMQGATVIVVAGIGILINSFTALLFLKNQADDLNLKAAFLHMIADALMSLGVVIVGLLYLYFEWLWLDPVVSLFISIAIILSALNLFKQTLHMMFDGVPDSIDLAKVYDYLKSIQGVIEVRDLHVWAMSTSNIALTAHLIIPSAEQSDALIDEIQDTLLDQFQISHATIQITKSPMGASCFNH